MLRKSRIEMYLDESIDTLDLPDPVTEEEAEVFLQRLKKETTPLIEDMCNYNERVTNYVHETYGQTVTNEQFEINKHDMKLMHYKELMEGNDYDE